MAYVAVVAILIDVETESEAMDAIAETLRPTMRDFNPSSCLRDWMWDYSAEGGSLLRVAPVPADFRMDQEWPDAA